MRKSIFTLASIGAAVTFFALPTFSYSAFAEESPAPLTQMQTPPPPHAEPEGEKREPAHRIKEEHEGSLDALQLVLVGGAIVIAAGLAYRAGRRRRDN